MEMSKPKVVLNMQRIGIKNHRACIPSRDIMFEICCKSHRFCSECKMSCSFSLEIASPNGNGGDSGDFTYYPNQNCLFDIFRGTICT